MHFGILLNKIKTCSDNGIVFNKEKFEFAEESINFSGFKITTNGYKPLPKILEAIQNHPTPKNITDVRSWFGLVNQLSCTFSQAPVMEPFHNLPSSKSFFWDSTIDEIFQKPKTEISKLVKDGIKTFETNRPNMPLHGLVENRNRIPFEAETLSVPFATT